MYAFRFDDAKYIETSSDEYYGSDFWENVIGTAKSYALSTKDISLYCYGEILNTAGNGRNYSAYTQNMSVTDNITSDNITSSIANGNAAGAAVTYADTGVEPEKLVLWAESHDTYMGSTGSAEYKNTKDISTNNINKSWAINASRKGATALYFARPDITMGTKGAGDWKDKSVVAINKFHNAYVGADEYLSYSGNIVINERYFGNANSEGGAVLVNANGFSTYVSGMKVNRLANGTYVDSITGEKFVVTDGYISGQIGNTGIAIIYGQPEENVRTESTKEIITFETKETTKSVETVETTQDTSTEPKETTTVQNTQASPGMVKIYFTNNKVWGKVNVYYWGSSKSIST